MVSGRPPKHAAFRGGDELTEIDFVKMQSAGNDLLMVNAIGLPPLDWSAVARYLCRRHFSIGADGLMVIERTGRGQYYARMFNPDGSEDMCGNGTLCSAVFLQHEGLIDGDEIRLTTLSGVKDVRFTIENGRGVAATVNLGRPQFDPTSIPARFDGQVVLKRELVIDGTRFTVSSLSTGTAHTIIFDDALPDDDCFEAWAPMIEEHEQYPEKTSVTWAVVDSEDRVRVRIWERGGVGESLACGTGACAVAAAGHRLGLTSSRVTVASKGGELMVELDDGSNTWLAGRPRRVFAGRIRYPLSRRTHAADPVML